MSNFSSLAFPSVLAPDPVKHVKYSHGMVLGVDDLTQEFSYVAQRDQWIIRDLIGYGTAWGLQVSANMGANGPEIVVSPGVGVNPRGQLMRVAPAQCAVLNDWLKARTEDVTRLRELVGSPPVARLQLYVVLSYAECMTDPVPIAGEPCRTEQDSVAPSRIADDFNLELRFAPPPLQQEEDALRAMVAWLRTHMTIVETGTASMSVADFLAALRVAAAPPATPPPTETFFTEASPPLMLTVPVNLLSEYLNAAMLVWVTELRPRWRPNWLGDSCDCRSDTPLALPATGNDLLLAALSIGINFNTVDPTHPSWEVLTLGTQPNIAPDVVIDESRRPWLLHQRFLQEWMLGNQTSTGSSTANTTTAIVAGGIVTADGTITRATLNNMTAIAIPLTPGQKFNELRVTFDGYTQPLETAAAQYLIKITPWPSAALTNPQRICVFVGDFEAAGFIVRVSSNDTPLSEANLANLQLMIEVTQYA
jgi:hypothetical protein